MQSNEAVPILKMLKELIKPNYPEKYIEAVDTAIEKLGKDVIEYRDEMRI